MYNYIFISTSLIFGKIAKVEVNKHLIHLAIKVWKKLQVKKLFFPHCQMK